METEQPSIKPIAYTYGLYLALMSILVLVIMYIGNMDKSWVLSVISSLVSIVIFVYGIQTFKKQNAGMISLGQAIKVGLAIAAVGAVIGGIYSYVHYEFIYPEFIDMQMETAQNQMIEQNPNMTQEQIDQAMGFTEIFMNSGFFSLSSVIGTLLFGLIVSLITGLVVRK